MSTVDKYRHRASSAARRSLVDARILRLLLRESLQSAINEQTELFFLWILLKLLQQSDLSDGKAIYEVLEQTVGDNTRLFLMALKIH